MSFDHDKRICIYPDYINGKRTVKQGRKVPVPKGEQHDRRAWGLPALLSSLAGA